MVNTTHSHDVSFDTGTGVVIVSGGSVRKNDPRLEGRWVPTTIQYPAHEPQTLQFTSTATLWKAEPKTASANLYQRVMKASKAIQKALVKFEGQATQTVRAATLDAKGILTAKAPFTSLSTLTGYSRVDAKAILQVISDKGRKLRSLMELLDLAHKPG